MSPVFRSVSETFSVRPVIITDATVCVTNAALFTGSVTVTTELEPTAPNSPLPSRIICQRKSYGPATKGALTTNAKTLVCPGATGTANATRFVPHTESLPGFTAASRKPAALSQVTSPVFLKLTTAL